MKTSTLLLASTTLSLHAGEPDLTRPVAPVRDPWVTPTLDIRARHEFGKAEGRDASHALTVRERIGLKTSSWHGFSALIEGEFSQALIDDYSGGAPLATPYDPANTVIPDPETNELNQLYLQYAGHDTTGRIGRQRIIYDNAAFVGNVGWRQNEQTYDGLSLSNQSIEDLSLHYAHISQVNRVFGSDAGGILENVESQTHLFNASYSWAGAFTLGAYAYLMEFADLPGWDNQTYGISAKTTLAGIALHGELALQNEAGPLNDRRAYYAHAFASKTLGSHSLTFGVEHLDAGFQTPLATLHAFNGFADVFVAGRAAGTHGGITNPYISHSLPIFLGMKWTNVLHAFGDNALSADLGWEFDSVLMKKFDDHFTGIAKFAHFESESSLPTTTRFSIELNYTF
jgi:hypothetical protein